MLRACEEMFQEKNGSVWRVIIAPEYGVAASLYYGSVVGIVKRALTLVFVWSLLGIIATKGSRFSCVIS